MAFNRAHGFTINVQRDFNQVDMGSRRHEIMQTLMKAACPGASYESAERADPPRCHPDTRKKVISRIMNWVNSSDPEKRILWLSATAGAGKSSIAQTIADKCAGEGKLLSSFFFSRTAAGSGRDDGNRLIHTIAYHLAVAVPDARDLIVSEIQRDPALFHHSMDVQLKTLVVDPIIRLVESEKIHIPFLVIIDGLDECNDIQVQSRIISTIAKSISETTSHIRFFFTSRPEREIRKVFDLLSVDNHTKKLSLKEDKKAYHDIEVYLNSEFHNIKNTHSLAIELRNNFEWPSNRDIWTLVNRSSGCFIYASTVMKYIADDNQDPREALSTIIHRPMMNFPDENPFAELDALYIHVLSTAASRTKGGYNAFLSILQVLTLTTGEGILTSSRSLAEFLGVTQSALTLRMMHLHSVIDLHSVTRPRPTPYWSQYGQYPPPAIKFHHASFKDFLLDPSRPEKFFVDVVEGHKFLGRRCLAFLPRTSQVPSNATSKFKYIMEPTMFNCTPRDLTTYALTYLFVHIEGSAFNVQLLNEFLHVVNVKSLISDMLNFMGGNATHHFLGLICSIDFDRAGEFAVPKDAGAADACKHISNAMDELVLEHFTDNPVPKTYIEAIYYGTAPRYGIAGQNDFFYGWATKIMDIPERAKHLYLSDQKAKTLILAILDAPVELGLGVVLGISHATVPRIIRYLFERTKPSLEFGHDLRKYLPRLKLAFDKEPVSDYSSVCSILKDCGLGIRIKRKQGRKFVRFSE